MKWFSLLYQGDIHPSSDEKVIKAKDYSQMVSSIEILEKARQDADKQIEKAKKEGEILKEKAKIQGKQEGLEKFNEQLLYLDRELKELRLKMQQLVLPIALKTAKRIVGKELAIFPETIVDIVLQALRPISESKTVTIYVSKSDKKELEKEKSKITEILQETGILTIVEKGDITPGGCIIQTEQGMINATIENQWKALEKAFEKYKQTT